MKEPVWVDRDDCLAMHEKLLDRFGGLKGIRDEGLLESALNKPVHHFSYGRPSVFELAASYAMGIVKNHPFLDGNKRTGSYLPPNPRPPRRLACPFAIPNCLSHSAWTI